MGDILKGLSLFSKESVGVNLVQSVTISCDTQNSDFNCNLLFGDTEISLTSHSSLLDNTIIRISVLNSGEIFVKSKKKTT